MSFTGMPRLPGVNKLRIAAVIVTVIIIIVILVEAVVTVQAGYRGVVLYLRRRAAFYYSLRRTSSTNGGAYAEIPSRSFGCVEGFAGSPNGDSIELSNRSSTSQ
jgi:hypothetical protein